MSYDGSMAGKNQSLESLAEKRCIIKQRGYYHWDGRVCQKSKTFLMTRIAGKEKKPDERTVIQRLAVMRGYSKSPILISP